MAKDKDDVFLDVKKQYEADMIAFEVGLMIEIILERIKVPNKLFYILQL